MHFSIENDLLMGANFLESPNQSPRADDCVVDLLVIHNISLPPGEFGNGCIDRFFCNQLDTAEHPFFSEIEAVKVSSHLMIDRQGVVTQYVAFNRKAWHAGESQHLNRSNCNDFSIGIELEGSDHVAFSELQYESLISVTKLLLIEYPCLNSEGIVGHSDIAPGRKTDPGPCFDWQLYKSSIMTNGIN